MPRVVLRERQLCGALDARDTPLQIDPPRRAEHVQMADARVDAQTLARRVPQSEIPLPWRSFFDRNERGHECGLAVDVLRADLDRFEEAERADALLCLLDRAAPEQIARHVRQSPPDDAIVHARVAGDVHGAEETDRARFGAHDHARPSRVDRLAGDANLCVRMAVVLKDFDSALARGFFQFIGESDADAKRQIARKLLAHFDGKRVEALEPDLFDDDGIFGSDCGRDASAGRDAAKQEGRAHRIRTRPTFIHVFCY